METILSKGIQTQCSKNNNEPPQLLYPGIGRWTWNVFE